MAIRNAIERVDREERILALSDPHELFADTGSIAKHIEELTERGRSIEREHEIERL